VKYSVLLLFSVMSFFMPPNLLAQHSEKEKPAGHQESGAHEQSAHHAEFKHNVIGLSIGHTHVSSGVRDGDRTWLSLPSFALHYAYFFNHKWALSLETEMIVESFVVQGSSSGSLGEQKSSEEETAVIERGRPIALTVIGIYKVHPNIGLMAGAGREFSEHEDFNLVKMGAEFPFHFGNNWEVFGTISWDFKIDAYDSFTFGFGVAKLF